MASAAGVWYNLTKDKECFDIEGSQDKASDSVAAMVESRSHRSHVLADARIAAAEQRAELAEWRAEKAEAELAALQAAQATAYPSVSTADSTASSATATAPSIDVRGVIKHRYLADETDGSTATSAAVGSCPACPPCDECPPCPVSYCDWEDEEPCTFPGQLSKTFSWEGTHYY